MEPERRATPSASGGRSAAAPPRISLETTLLALAFALTAGALGWWIVRRAPLSLHLPPTILTNAHPASRPASAYLIFLRAVRRAVPPGAIVRVVAPREPTGDAWMNFALAVGQLPEQRVRLGPAPAELGEWIAVYPAGALPGTPFRRVDGGDLFRP